MQILMATPAEVPDLPEQITSWAQFIGLILAPAMTYAVGYLTKASWPGKWKGGLLVGLSFINGVLVEAFTPRPEGESFDLRSAVFRAALAFVVAQGLYVAVLKKSASLLATQNSGVTDKTIAGEFRE